MHTDTPVPVAPAPFPRRSPWRRAGAWGAGLLLVPPTLTAAFRAADADGITPVPQLLAFLPWLLVPSGAGLLLAGLARWRAGAVWAGVVTAALAWFTPPPGQPPQPAGEARARLTVLTANVEFGNATEALLTTIAREKPDVVFVPECAYPCSRAIEDRVSRADYPHRVVVEGEHAFGSALLSKYPLDKPAKDDGIAGTLAMPGAVATVDGGLRVRLQLTHPMPPVPGQTGLWKRELGAIRDAAAVWKEKGERSIVAGDFNASADHAAFRELMAEGSLADAAGNRAPSWPSAWSPPFGTQIDHVLLSEGVFGVREAKFLDLANTDHRALLVDLDLY